MFIVSVTLFGLYALAYLAGQNLRLGEARRLAAEVRRDGSRDPNGCRSPCSSASIRRRMARWIHHTPVSAGSATRQTSQQAPVVSRTHTWLSMNQPDVLLATVSAVSHRLPRPCSVDTCAGSTKTFDRKDEQLVTSRTGSSLLHPTTRSWSSGWIASRFSFATREPTHTVIMMATYVSCHPIVDRSLQHSPSDAKICTVACVTELFVLFSSTSHSPTAIGS